MNKRPRRRRLTVRESVEADGGVILPDGRVRRRGRGELRVCPCCHVVTVSWQMSETSGRQLYFQNAVLALEALRRLDRGEDFIPVLLWAKDISTVPQQRAMRLL